MHFIVANVLSPAVKYGTVALLAWLVKLAREHVRHQRAIRDLLDTHTAGGLADVVDALKDKP